MLWAWAAEFPRAGVECRLAGLADEWTDEDCGKQGVAYDVCRKLGPAAFGFSRALRCALKEHHSDADLVHCHGLWMYPGVVARQFASRHNKPFLISPHGMLEPWALNHSRWKKRLAAWTFEKRNLDSAACLHALCSTEAENFRRCGLCNPIAVVPNGVDTALFQTPPARAALEARFPMLCGRRWALFLSRIHPKKGLLHFLQAWQAAGVASEWVLIAAGPDEGGHEAEAKRLSAELGVAGRVCFTGPLHGDDKLAALAGAELFVLPSFSEGFSVAVLEAAAASLPVMLTPQCNFPELAKAGAAIEVSPDVAGCLAGLRRILGLAEAERQAMGERGRELVARNYAWPVIAEQMIRVYHWLIEGGNPPACVRLN